MKFPSGIFVFSFLQLDKYLNSYSAIWGSISVCIGKSLSQTIDAEKMGEIHTRKSAKGWR